MQIQKNRSFLYLTLSIVVVVLLAGFTIYMSRNNDDPMADNQSPETQEIDGSSGEFNPSPATEEDQQRADSIKEELLNSENDSGSEEERVSVTPIISRVVQNDEKLEIRAFVQSNNKGECKVLLENASGDKYTETSSSSLQPSYYQCNGFSIPIENLKPGSWTITIEFVSDSEFGTSDKKEIDIQ